MNTCYDREVKLFFFIVLKSELYNCICLLTLFHNIINIISFILFADDTNAFY